jgi:hypothetical protein
MNRQLIILYLSFYCFWVPFVLMLEVLVIITIKGKYFLDDIGCFRCFSLLRYEIRRDFILWTGLGMRPSANIPKLLLFLLKLLFGDLRIGVYPAQLFNLLPDESCALVFLILLHELLKKL